MRPKTKPIPLSTKRAATLSFPSLFFGAVAALLVLVAIGARVEATVLESVSTQKLVKRSGWIVRGQVKCRRSFWNRKKTRIYTRVTLKVTKSYKGGSQPGETLTLLVLGGQVGRVVQRVLGTPRFKPREEVVVFLQKRGAYRMVVGMTQGKFRLEKDKRSGRLYAFRNLSAVRASKTGRRLPARLQLSALEALIEKAVRRSSKGGP